jgi:hypothetical protein
VRSERRGPIVGHEVESRCGHRAEAVAEVVEAQGGHVGRLCDGRVPGPLVAPSQGRAVEVLVDRGAQDEVARLDEVLALGEARERLGGLVRQRHDAAAAALRGRLDALGIGALNMESLGRPQHVAPAQREDLSEAKAAERGQLHRDGVLLVLQLSPRPGALRRQPLIIRHDREHAHDHPLGTRWAAVRDGPPDGTSKT